MVMDLRLPSGMLFVLLGTILTLLSFLSDAHARLSDANVNLWCGLSMLVFGGILLWLARRSA
jgi:hypothetical protein